MKNYIFTTTLDEFDDVTAQPGFVCREMADGRMMLPENGPYSIETVFSLAEVAARNGGDWRSIVALIAPEKLVNII
jgi:hypothetical protein